VEELYFAAEFLKHINPAFWALNEKVAMHVSSFPASSFLER